MRGIVEVSDDPLTWVDLSKPATELRRDVADLIDSFILGIFSGKQANLNSVMKGNLKEHEKGLLEICLRQVPIAQVIDKGSVDFPNGDMSSAYPLSNSKIINEVKTLARYRAAAFSEGTSSVSAYERALAPFIRLSKRVEIMDPYSGAAINSERENRTWFLKKLIQEKVPEIEFTLCIPGKDDFKTSGMSFRQKVASIENAAALILNSVPGAISKIAINFYLPDPKVFHNRRLRISFESGSIACSLDNGIDGIGQDPVAPGSKYSQITSNEFQIQLGAIKSLMRNKYLSRVEIG